MVQGKEAADGVLVYCHQHKDSNPEKYEIIKRLFARWSKAAPGLRSPKQTE
jgi:hypothetical protein